MWHLLASATFPLPLNLLLHDDSLLPDCMLLSAMPIFFFGCGYFSSRFCILLPLTGRISTSSKHEVSQIIEGRGTKGAFREEVSDLC